MKNRSFFMAIIIVILFLTSMSYYEWSYAKLESNRHNHTVVNSDKENNTDIEENHSSLEDENTNESSDSNHSNLSSNENKSTDSETNAMKSNQIKLHAISAALMDAESNRVLYEKNGYKELPMASTTKIMTCIVTLENANLDDMVNVSKYAASMPDVQLNIKAGEQYKLKDLLYSLMLESHNDVAVAIAEHVGGSVEGFAAMMNKKAKELGCSHTNFVTPNGLDDEYHYTTAVELAKITSYAIKNKEFIEITNTSSYQFSDARNKRNFTVNNKDRFLTMYNGAIGVKTGFTGKAGYCFVGAVDKDGKTFISVVLGCGWPPNKNYKWSDTKNLMDYGVKNYNYQQIFNANQKFNPIFVEDGQESYVDLYYEGDIKVLMRADEEVKVIIKVPKTLKAPVKEGIVVGSAKYYVGDDLIKEVPILTKTSSKRIDFNYCWKKIKNMWFVN